MYLRCLAAIEALLLLLLPLLLALLLLLETSFQSLSAARRCWLCYGKRRAMSLSPAGSWLDSLSLSSTATI
jgi:hypothetical protein